MYILYIFHILYNLYIVNTLYILHILLHIYTYKPRRLNETVKRNGLDATLSQLLCNSFETLSHHQSALRGSATNRIVKPSRLRVLLNRFVQTSPPPRFAKNRFLFFDFLENVERISCFFGLFSKLRACNVSVAASGSFS